MRIAHIIIAHKNPIQLERLLDRMEHPDFDFYIHLDKKIDMEPFKHLGNKTRVKFIQNRLLCNWGGYSTLRAMVSSLKEVLDNDVTYQHYNLLSAQDYPLKTNSEIYNFFLHNKDRSYVYYEKQNESKWWIDAVERFERYHLTDFKFKGKSSIERIINKVLPKRKFPISVELYGGSKSSWWSLNEDAAVYVTEFLKKGNDLDSFLKYCWGTDEFVIPTVLLNSPIKSSIVNNNLRYIDFPEGKANPKILTNDDLKSLIESEMLFGRKFDIDINADVLDIIDKHIDS